MIKPRVRYNGVFKVWVCSTLWDLNFTIGIGSSPMAAYADWISKGDNAKRVLESLNPITTITMPEVKLSWCSRIMNRINL